MKGQVVADLAVAVVAVKRWRRSLAAMDATLALLFFSIIVPLVVLLGLHMRFPSNPYLIPLKTLPFSRSLSLLPVYLGDESAVLVYGGREGGSWEPNPLEENNSTRANKAVKKFSPTILKFYRNQGWWRK